MENLIIRVGALVFVYGAAGFSAACARYAQSVEITSGFVTTPDGVRIHYLQAGRMRSQFPAILFVPGWTMPAEIWQQQIAHFARTRRVVAMEARSQGLSSQTSEGNYPEARARDIKAVVSQLHLAPVTLVGWSMGVSELVAYIDQFGSEGVAGLVLVDGIPGWEIEPGLRQEMFEFVDQFQKDRMATTARFVRQMYQRPQSQEYLDRITQASLRTPANTALALLLGMARDRRAALAKIDRPTLIVVAAGPYQRIFDDMQRRIAGSQLKVMDGVGHALFVDAADQFNALLDDFVRTLAPSVR